jgi:membrane-associated protease RseP (regulator of RpoE activity)
VGRLFGNKLLVLNTSSAREWKFIFMGAGYVTGVNAEMVTQDLDASDQRSFIEKGIPAVQFFSGAHRDYHRPSDTVDKIDAAGLVKVAFFVREGVVYLAEREEPLTFMGKTTAAKGRPSSAKKQGGRRVTTGSMPDFSYNGEGVRLADVPKDSPAGKAGLVKGDILTALGKTEIKNMRDYANALGQYKSGDTAEVTFLRDGNEKKAKIKLIER